MKKETIDTLKASIAVAVLFLGVSAFVGGCMYGLANSVKRMNAQDKYEQELRIKALERKQSQ